MPNPDTPGFRAAGGEAGELQLAWHGGVAGLCISLGFAGFHLWLGFDILAAIALLSAAVNAGAVWAAQRRHLALSRTCSLAGLAVVVVGITGFTGGFSSAALLWALIIPVAATVGVDARLVRGTSVVAAAFVVLFFVLDLLELLPVSPLSPRQEKWFLLGTLLSLLASIATVQSNAMLRRLEFEAERERALHDLKVARERAEAANLAKSRFVSHMSHEIRTPLNGVLGLAQLLRDSPLNPAQLEHVDMLHQSGEVLLGIINEVLDFSKIEAGRIDLESLPYSPATLVEDAALLFAGVAALERTEIVVDVSPNLPAFAQGDALRIRQVLTNLVGNAVKFTSAGRVTVAATLEGAAGHSPALRVEVADTGVGIPTEALESLFQPFTQADASTTRRFGGTGLGLAICRRLVERMGGSLEVQSTEGVGSTFAISLPLHSPTPPARVVADLVGKSILVVDDHPRSRAVTERVVAATGAHVVACDWAAAPAQRAAKEFAAMVLVHAAAGDDDALPAQVSALAFGGPTLVLAPRLSAPLRAWAGGLPEAILASRPWRDVALRDALAALLGRARGQPASSADVRVAADVRARVLVAEDNAVNLAVVTGMLHRLACEVVTVTNGADAVRAASEATFDLVLMDCQMPELDGLEATRRIRSAEGGSRHTPILALTADVLPEQRASCLAAGMDDTLSKPLRASELDGAVRKWAGLAAPDPNAVLAELDPVSAQTVLDLFRVDAPEQAEAVLNAIGRGEIAAAVRVAHGLKSAAMTIGLGELASVAARVEQELPGVDGHLRQELGRSLRHSVRRAVRTLERWDAGRGGDAFA